MEKAMEISTITNESEVKEVTEIIKSETKSCDEEAMDLAKEQAKIEEELKSNNDNNNGPVKESVALSTASPKKEPPAKKDVRIVGEQVKITGDKMLTNAEKLALMAQNFCFGALNNADLYTILGIYSKKRRMAYTERFSQTELADEVGFKPSSVNSSSSPASVTCKSTYKPTIPSATATVFSSIASAISSPKNSKDTLASFFNRKQNEDNQTSSGLQFIQQFTQANTKPQTQWSMFFNSWKPVDFKRKPLKASDFNLTTVN